MSNSPQILIIPLMKNIAESLSLAKEYNAGFEYNDFAMPWTLDNEANCEKLIKAYKETPDMPAYTTAHGDFFDVLVFSDDPRIKEISELRVRQSMECAKKLGCKGIVFHGNINPLLIGTAAGPAYVKHWLEATRDFFRTICAEYPEINIYMENMFDRSPDNLEKLAAEMKDIPNFGICFDYAHAAISPTDTEIWSKKLSPYIRHVHINDNDGHQDLHMAVGFGSTDWRKFFTLQKKYFPDATILVETSSLENQKKSLEFLRKLNFIG